MGIQTVNLDGGKLPFREFKLEYMVEHPSIVIIAKRGSGKSYVCRAILKKYSHIPIGIVISPTDRMNSFYGTFIPDSYVYYEYNTDIITRLLSRQKKMIKKKQEKKLLGKKIDSRSYIIMDDCLSSKTSWMKDQPIKELLFNGRHYEIMYILIMQFPLGITPEMRSQFDYIFLLAEDIYSNLKRLYDHYCGMFPTFDSFRQVFSQLTANYGSMVISNTMRKSKMNEQLTGTFLDKVFWYKAINEDVLNMGCKQYQAYHDKNYNKSWADVEDKIDVNEFCIQKKKEKDTIIVEKVKTD
jgi:hypothetical protein